MAGKPVWIVLHCQICLTLRNYVVDEVVAFVASSKGKALRMIKSHIPDSGTWWRLECVRLDGDEGALILPILFSPEGRVLKSAPLKSAYRVTLVRYRKAVALMKEHLAKMRRKGDSPQQIRLRMSSIRSMSRTLASHPLRKSLAQ